MQQLVEQLAQHRITSPTIEPLRQAGRDYSDALAAAPGVERRPAIRRGLLRLLEHEDVVRLGEPRHQVLRSLKDKVPAQMRKADERRAAALRACPRAFHIDD